LRRVDYLMSRISKDTVGPTVTSEGQGTREASSSRPQRRVRLKGKHTPEWLEVNGLFDILLVSARVLRRFQFTQTTHQVLGTKDVPFSRFK
jgi:hypothetical protein